ncbi:hypothetical protein E3A20_28210, partial [Planctomyces bekefii]
FPLLFFALLILLVYSYGDIMTAPFVFDDGPNIVTNPNLRSPSQIWDLFLAGPARFFGYLSFAVNLWIHGPSTPGFHLVNTLIHLLAACVVYGLTCWVVSQVETNKTRVQAAGVWASLIFAVHPIQTQAVTYIVQRFTSLSSLFYLTALLCYGLSLEKKNSRAFRILAILAYASAGLAVMTKQIAITLPLAMILLHMTLGSRSNSLTLETPDPHSKSPSLLSPRTWRTIGPFFLIAAIGPLIAVVAGDYRATTVGAAAAGLASTAARGPTWPVYILTQIPVTCRYLQLVFWPVQQNLDHDIPWVQSLDDVMAQAGSLALLLALLAVGFWARRKRPLLAFGILFFFLALSVEALVPLPDVSFEHRIYLPLWGILLAAIDLWHGALD